VSRKDKADAFIEITFKELSTMSIPVFSSDKYVLSNVSTEQISGGSLPPDIK